MFSSFGLSVYLSSFEKQKPILNKLKGKNIPIFISLHIEEEFSPSYVTKTIEMCRWLTENQFYIIADVSPVSLKRFKVKDLKQLVELLKIDNLRLDFGFDSINSVELQEDVDLTFNASTLLDTSEVQAGAYYMHNFYPRPETGLDKSYLNSLNAAIKSNGGHSLAFMSGDLEKRGPIQEGLPSIEDHRYLPPYVQFLDLIKNHQCDSVFVGDGLISEKQLELILSYIEDELIQVPVVLNHGYEAIKNRDYSVRIDSPEKLVRVQKSRQINWESFLTQPQNTKVRNKGCITMDNNKYGRYTGELQILNRDLPAHEKVNVVGQVKEEYLGLLDCLNRRDRFTLT